MPRNKQVFYHIKVWSIDGSIGELHYFAIYSLAPGCRLGTESSLLEVKVADLSSGKMIHSLTLRSMKYWNIYKYYTRDSHLINVDWTIHAQCDEWPYPDGEYYLDIWVLLLVTHRDQDIGLDDEPAGTVELGCQPHVCWRRCVLQWSIIVTLSPRYSPQSPDRLPAAVLLLGMSTKFRETFTTFGEANYPNSYYLLRHLVLKQDFFTFHTCLHCKEPC